MLDFTQFPLLLNIGLFAAAAVVVWLGGSRIAGYAETLSDRFGLGHALVGMVLLGGVTSLPEIAVTVTAAAYDNPRLAVNNLFGSIAMQVAILAVVDFAIGRRALTAALPDPLIMLQGILNILLLAIVLGGMMTGDRGVFGIGIWAWAALAAYLCSIWVLSRAEGRKPWIAAHAERAARRDRGEAAAEQRRSDDSTRRVIGKTMLAGLLILIGGYTVAQTGEAIAQQTGLGASFVGFVLVAISTSLPELSSALTAARLGLYTMAISDILGTNLINIALLFAVDAVASGEPVLNQVDRFSAFGAILGIVVTALFVAGLSERRDRTVFRMGIDSILVLVAYTGGVVLLYQLR